MGQSRDGVFGRNGQCLVCQRHGRWRRLVSLSIVSSWINSSTVIAHQTREDRVRALDLVPGSLAGGISDPDPDSRGCAWVVAQAPGGDLVFLWSRGEVHSCRGVCESADESLAIEYDVGGEELDHAAVVGYIDGGVGGGV